MQYKTIQYSNTYIMGFFYIFLYLYMFFILYFLYFFLYFFNIFFAPNSKFVFFSIFIIECFLHPSDETQ